MRQNLRRGVTPDRAACGHHGISFDLTFITRTYARGPASVCGQLFIFFETRQPRAAMEAGRFAHNNSSANCWNLGEGVEPNGIIIINCPASLQRWLGLGGARVDALMWAAGTPYYGVVIIRVEQPQ